MGRLFLIQYDLTPDFKFFLCRFCRAHIALHSNYVFLDGINYKGLFRDVVNVVIDGPERYRMEGNNRVANVHCTRCNALLGIKFIEVQNNNSTYVGAGIFELNMRRVLCWNGNRFDWIIWI